MGAPIWAWVITIAIGALAGWLASRIMGNEQGLLMDILLGVAGSIVGGWIATLFGFETNALLWQFLLVLLGAVILLAIKQLIFGRKTA